MDLRNGLQFDEMISFFIICHCSNDGKSEQARTPRHAQPLPLCAHDRGRANGGAGAPAAFKLQDLAKAIFAQLVID